MECILNQVSSLSDLEKLVLYLKLPTGIARQHTNPSSGNNGTSTESGKIEVQVANRWIKTRLQVDKDVCLPKQDVYDAYREYCDKESHKWVNQADFGKLIKGIYPDVRTRRLGNRGQSKHCYGGLSMHFVELPVPETLSIEIPSPTSTPPKVPGSSVNGEVLPAACVVVCEWASKVLEQKVGDIIQLAQYLVTHNLVTMCSTAALTISASVPKKTSLSTDAGSAPSTPTTPVPGKQREAQIQLQRKLHEKEQLKKQKEKQRNITAESSATSIQQQQQQQGTGTSSSSVAVLSSGGQQTPVTSAPVAPEAVAPSSSAAVQRLMFVSPSAGSASTNTSMGNPVVSAPSGVPATNVLMFSPQSQDKPVQHKPKNKYSSKTVSFLLKEQRGFNSQDKDDKLAYVNDTRPVSQLLKESRERKQKTMTSALKVSTTNAPQPILIKPMSPNSQGKLPSNGKPQQTEENSLLENQQQTSASELLQTFSQLKQQQQQNSELNQLPQQFTSLQEQQPPVQQQQQPQLQQQQQLQVQQQQVQQPQQPQVQQQFQVQQQQQQPQQPLLQQVQQQSLVQQQQQQQSLVQQQQSLAQQQSMLQQQQDQQQLQQQLQLLDQQQQQQQGQGHMMQQQMQQMQQQPQMQQLQQLCDQQLMQPRQSVDFNPQFDASYSNVGAGNNGFEQFVASPGSGSGSLASATSTPMLSPACLSPMLSNTEPSNSFTPIQQHSTLQQMHRTHGSMEQNTADFMNYGQTNNNNNLNLMMKNNTDMMFQRGMDFNTQYNMQQPAKRTMTQMADASKRRRHCSAPNKPVSGMFANPNTLPILKQFPAAMAGAQEQQQEQQQQQQQPMNMMDSSASYGSTEQWATQPSPEVATILQQPVQGEQAMPPPAPGEQEAALSRSRSVPVPVIDDLADLFNEPGSVFLTPTVPAPCKNMTNQYTQPLQDNSNNPFNNLLLPQTTDEKSPYISGHRGDHMISGASVNDSIATRMKRLAAYKMALFGGGGNTSFGNTANFSSSLGNNHNPMKDVEVSSPPDDSVSSLTFSPACLSNTFLIAGSWDNNVRCWEVQSNGQTVPKAQQTHTGPVLDACWSDDGSKVFTASCDKTAKMWDLNSNQAMQVAQHDAPVKTVNWVKAPTYTCLMTSSWDKTLKFWDTRTPNPMMTIQLPERAYCADVLYPMAVVGTASRGVIIYQLENQPQEFKRIESPLKYQHRCVKIFLDKKTNAPTGFALGSIEGRVAIHYVNPQNPKDNFTFKCHRANGTTGGYQDIFAVNSIAFHPVHGTLSTVGSDGRFSFWDKDARTKLKTSDQLDQPITACAFNAQGTIFAYSSSYDWSKGHEGFDPQKMKPRILLRSCFDELKPSQKKS